MPRGQLEQQLAQAQRAVIDLRQQLAQADAPRINTPIIELTPIATTRGGHTPPGESHDIEIAGAGDRVVWRGSGVTQSAFGTMTLVVPRALLGPRETIRLYEPVHHRLLEQYAVPALIP